MQKALLNLLNGLLCLALCQTTAWGQAYGQRPETYHFGQVKKEPSKKLPKAQPGRVHLRDGSSRNVPLAYVDYNRIVAIEDDKETAYTPLEVSSFVIKQDSFVVLKDFKVASGGDEQEFRLAFVQLSVAGPDFMLYHFKGTMRREQAAQLVGGGGGMAMGQIPASTQYLMSKVWFIKRDADPRWLSLPGSGQGLTAIVEPMVADDKKLSRSIDWNYVSDGEVQKILAEYVANKKAAPKQ